MLSDRLGTGEYNQTFNNLKIWLISTLETLTSMLYARGGVYLVILYRVVESGFVKVTFRVSPSPTRITWLAASQSPDYDIIMSMMLIG